MISSGPRAGEAVERDATSGARHGALSRSMCVVPASDLLVDRERDTRPSPAAHPRREASARLVTLIAGPGLVAGRSEERGGRSLVARCRRPRFVGLETAACPPGRAAARRRAGRAIGLALRPGRGGLIGREPRRLRDAARSDVSTCAISPTVGARSTVPVQAWRTRIRRRSARRIVEAGLSELLDEQAREIELFIGRRGRSPTPGRTACPRRQLSPAAPGGRRRRSSTAPGRASRPCSRGDAAQVLDPEDMPGLAEMRGHGIVTSDGTTLLDRGRADAPSDRRRCRAASSPGVSPRATTHCCLQQVP